MRYCENCGTEIDLCDKFCIECGAIRQEQIENNFCEECGNAIDGCIVKEATKSPATWQSEANNRFVISSDNQEAVTAFNLQKARNRKSKSKTVTALIVIVAVLIVPSGVLAYFYFDKRNTGGNTYPLESDTKFKSESTTEETTTELPKPVANPSDYLGYWHLSDSPQSELAINSIVGDKVGFTLWSFPNDPIEDISANLNGNVASFLFNRDGVILKGFLTFNESSITLDIIESNSVDMPVVSYIFNDRHQQSWVQLYNYGNDEPYGFMTQEEIPPQQQIPSPPSTPPTPPTPPQTQSPPSIMPQPSTQSAPKSETKSVVVDGITFNYQSSCSIYYGYAFVNINSLEIKCVDEYSSLKKFEFRIDGEVTEDGEVADERRCYIKYYEYDEDDYLLDKSPLFSGVSGKFKESNEGLINKNTVRVEIVID